MNRKRSLTKSLFIILVIIPALILMPLAFAQETATLTAEPSAQTLFFIILTPHLTDSSLLRK